MKRPAWSDVDLKEGVVPITRAVAGLAELIKRAQVRRHPIIITQNGYPTAVLLDIDTFTMLRDLAERQLASEADPADVLENIPAE